ncbi:hypothetical protein M3Y98_01077000 [Aphelenchoides besseyi]|nr:hypothetical protein M3Y98_01077000 [Aphelenchoides besseyi]
MANCFVVIFTIIHQAHSLFPGATPEDGDYRHLYPKLCLSLRIFETEHSFSYQLGWLEDLKYPKDRIHFQFLVQEDSLLQNLIKRWSISVGRFYISVQTDETTANEWYEQALVFGRKKTCAFAFLTTSDIFLRSDSLLNLIANDKVVVSPLVIEPFALHSNGRGLVESHHLTGQVKELLQLSSLLNYLHDSRSTAILHSNALPAWYPEPTTFGFDRVYVVNLQRRPERMKRMESIMKLLGIDYVRFNATDGRTLTEKELSDIHVLPGYLDPYHKRPLKRGEIGCFLSHYRIWTEIVTEKLDRVLIFEDDIRFTENSTKILRGMVEDLMKMRDEWDLIYLGRKKNDANAQEFYVRGHRYLSTVTYSYWTLGYAISQRGAQKLLDAEPLKKLVALDEFLPIMYDQHPNNEWSFHFENRDLLAFSVYPLVVTPMKYTHEPGYVSDTEDSILLNSTLSSSQLPSAVNSAMNIGLTNEAKTEL